MKKNVLFVVNQLHRGGAQKVVANLSNNLASASNIHIVIYNDVDQIDYAYSGTLIKIRLPFARNSDNNPFYARIVRFFSLIYNLRKIKRKYKIDVSISFMEASNFVNVLSRRREKIVLSVRTFLSEELGRVKGTGVYKVFIRFLYNRVEHIVVPSTMMKHDLCGKFGVSAGRIKVIHNFIDIDKMAASAQETIEYPAVRRLFTENKVLVSVGRLDVQKGQDYLFPVLAAVKASVSGIKLLLVGDGPLKEGLVNKATGWGLKVCTPEQLRREEGNASEYDVYFLGAQQNPFKYLDKRSIFVFPSLYEGFPNALLEAMVCGLPVISTDCLSGPRELLAPGTDLHYKTPVTEYASYGILMPDMPGQFKGQLSDIQGEIVRLWTEAVLKLIAEPDWAKEYAQKAAFRAKDFGKDIIVAQWNQLIYDNP